MRFIFFLFLSTLVFAKQSDVCYTIQLFSIPLSQKEQLKESQTDLKDECKLMEISKTVTMRCGCYEHIKNANRDLVKYKEKYRHAVVAMSYKHRFKSAVTTDKKITKTKKRTKSIVKIDTQENELRLLLQSFLYSQDLQNALQTAKIALREKPSSLYWNQKMAEVLRWMGRGEEAIQYMEYIYYRTKKPQLAKEIIDYALDSYQYEKVKKLIRVAYLNNPTQKNKQRMLFIYHQIGIPQEAALVLQSLYNKNHDPLLLTDILQIYMDMEDLKSAKKIIDIIENKQYYSSRNIELISYYHYIMREMPKAYDILTKYDFSKKYDRHLNELLSDLGWYLQHNKRASKASLELIKHKNGRLVDYERVIYTNRDTNPQLALEMTKEGFAKYHLDYLFYDFANQALKEKKITFLQETITAIDNSDSPLKKQANYWIIKARLYQHLQQKGKTVAALKEAEKIANYNPTATLQIIDIYMQLSMNAEVKYLLNQLTQKQELSHSYLLIISALYFTIHDVNQAAFYLQKLKEYNSPLQKSIEFKFLQDDIYKAQFNENAHFKTLREINKILAKQLHKHPEIKNDDLFLYNSLRVSLHLDSIDTFKHKLLGAKKYLTQEHYDDLAYSYAAKTDSKEMAHTIYLHSRKKPIWLQFANALLEEDHTSKAKLLLYHLHQIPRDDASYGAHQIGDIALAQSLAFSSLDENQKNKNAYISMLNYTKERSNLLSIKSAYYNRKPLLQKYIDIDNSYYLENGYYLLNSFYYTKSAPLDGLTLIYVPATTTKLSAGIKKIFDNAQITLNLSAVHALKNYYCVDTAATYKINNYFTTEVKVAKNIKADESIELLLGGKKDSYSIKLVNNIFNSTAVELKYTHNRYTSQDNIYIGKSSYINALIGYQIRNGYPDMRIVFAADYATFNESYGPKGAIELLRRELYNLLPKNFYDFGVTFEYGMQNSRIYTRVWRPFFEISSYYNSETSGISYSINAGYGGKVYLQDHLVFGLNYSNNISGIKGTLFELFLRYEFLYPSGF